MRKRSYSISGKWAISAPLDKVWNAVVDPETWKQWWPDVKSVKKLDQPKLTGIRWRGIPGHSLYIVVDMEDFKDQENQQYKFSGDISGHGELWLRPKNRHTTVITFGWEIQTVLPWMNYAPTWVQKLFSWLGERSMRRAERGLNKYLAENSD